MTTRKASCSCGQLTVTTSGEPQRVGVCHCLACQQRTGSAFGVQARFLASDVVIAGRSTTYERTGDEGHRVRFQFCPDCGATVHWQMDIQPELIAIAVGAFADPTFPRPSAAVYTVRRHAWVELAGDVVRYD